MLNYKPLILPKTKLPGKCNEEFALYTSLSIQNLSSEEKEWEKCHSKCHKRCLLTSYQNQSYMFKLSIHKVGSMKNLSFFPSSVTEELPIRGIFSLSNAELDTYQVEIHNNLFSINT